MARFMATIQGQRGSASRLGSVSSGITTTTNGWNIGVEVIGDADGAEDDFAVYATSGSNGGDRRQIARVRVLNGKRTAIMYDEQGTICAEFTFDR